MSPLKHILPVIAVALATTVPAYADCVLPPPPSRVPDGATASQQEMATAMQTLRDYNGDVDTYNKCLDFEAKQNHLSATDVMRMHNTAVETLQKVAAKFNEQVRTFKAKSS